ncbi:AMP-binding protein [Paraburkholderia azotifigens]|uniref:class I adenylate-forming enzyme family protein n=1 Tax=Paraburkholderia azotifigens TaxID=2057004 RepID=UPI00317DC84D
MKTPETAVFRSYVDVLLDRLEQHADRAMLRYLDGDVTGRALRASIYRHARALAMLGIKRGSLVAQFAPNCPDALAIRYAANLLGAATTFLPAIASAETRAAYVARIRPTLLVAFAQTARLVPDAIDARVVYVGTGDRSRLDHLARMQPDLPVECSAQPDDLAVIVASGGSTGVPKASRRSFAAYATLVSAPSPADRRQLVNGALAYLSQVLVDNTLLGGGTVVLKPRYDPADTLATIEAERITDLLLVEPQLFETMDHRDAGRRDLSSLRAIVHMGGSAPAILRRRAIARFGPVLTHMYGASEAGLVSVLTPSDYLSDPRTLESAGGRIRPGVEVRIRHADGRLARDGEPGGIEVKSAAVAQGYRHQPSEAARKFRDGWCVTGDVGFIDAKGYLQVLGRAADVAETDGVVIAPAQIEAPLCALPQVRYAVAIATGDSACGFGWNVVATPWPRQRIDIEQCMRAIEAACGAQVARAVRLIAAQRVPLTEQGKVDGAAIGQMCEARLNATDSASNTGNAQPASERLHGGIRTVTLPGRQHLVL